MTLVAWLRRRLRRRWTVLWGAAALVILVGGALFAPAITRYDPIAQNTDARLRPPSVSHPLGTDQYGRDIFSRVAWGARASLEAGAVAVSVGLTLGFLSGCLAGYLGGWTDLVVMRVIDALSAFPPLLLALTIVSVLGPGLVNVMTAIGVASIPGFARLVRAEVLVVKEQEYLTAARAIGVGYGRIMAVYVLPNVLGSALILATLNLATAIITEANLSFVGLGLPPPTPSWGGMVSDGFRYLFAAPWLSMLPGVAITLAVLGFNLVGDGLRDLLDPRSNVPG